jgi:hypothetical protein
MELAGAGPAPGAGFVVSSAERQRPRVVKRHRTPFKGEAPDSLEMFLEFMRNRLLIRKESR